MSDEPRYVVNVPQSDGSTVELWLAGEELRVRAAGGSIHLPMEPMLALFLGTLRMVQHRCIDHIWLAHLEPETRSLALKVQQDDAAARTRTHWSALIPVEALSHLTGRRLGGWASTALLRGDVDGD